ncbi:FtsX-like permease family protein [Candidatus Poribacteria bacterium]|nr:FtsX-like permease family protein [Candidatus Poribacteria bacterium]MYA56727.1 FtsX-like permease family protein [Candidatus Poribacteria bacterium]
MRIVEGISVGISAIRSNKLRSLLTMLGIIIGVASVLAMIAIGDGAKMIVLQDAQKLGGVNQFTMYRSSHKRVNNRWVPNRSNEYFEYEDVLAIEAECPSVKLVVPRIPEWRGVLVQAAGGAEHRTGYNGVNASFSEAMDWGIQQGRFITNEDIDNEAKICVLGAEVTAALFGNDSPVGKEIKIGKGPGGRFDRYGRKDQKRITERFTVVGTMETRGRSLRFGWNLDDMIFIPLTTAQERFTGNDRIVMLSVHANTVEEVPQAIEEVKTVLRKMHHGQDDFFSIWDMREGMAQLDKISKVIKIALGSIAGFSLLVGGIGIMNMMLVAVTERTREIGLRKAIGAKRLDILLQFLIEAIAMCSVGGALGVVLGLFAGEGMAMLAVNIVQIVPEWPSVISTEWILISVSFSAIIGISFGLYPAIKASGLSPIEALRAD